MVESQVSRAITMLKGILNGADRIGSDEIYDINQVINVLKTINGDNTMKKEEKRGLIAGYKPNRISFYILLLISDRLDELSDVLYKDMEPWKEGGQNA